MKLTNHPEDCACAACKFIRARKAIESGQFKFPDIKDFINAFNKMSVEDPSVKGLFHDALYRDPEHVAKSETFEPDLVKVMSQILIKHDPDRLFFVTKKGPVEWIVGHVIAGKSLDGTPFAMKLISLTRALAFAKGDSAPLEISAVLAVTTVRVSASV